MSAYDGYDDEPRRYRSVRTRPRERDEPDFVREEVYIERGKGPGPRGAELVYRGRDDSTEDIPRDFPPPGRDRRSGYDDSRRNTGGRRYDDDYDDDRYTDYAAPAAAGAAGYAAGRHRSDRSDRRSRRDDRDYDSEYSNSPPRRERKKSGGVTDLLGSLGLGGLVGGLAGSKDKDRDRSQSPSGSRGGRSARSRSRGARSRRGYSSDGSGRSRSRGGNNERKWAQAAQAALVAGAVEAFRSRKTPGSWTGEKGKRVATAALGAGGIDGLVSGTNPDEKSKRHLAGAVIGGLGINRAANGSRSQVRGDDSRSVSPDGRPRSRSRARSRSRSVMDRLRGRSQSRGPNSDAGGGSSKSGLAKGLLGAGAAAAAGKAIYDRVRSKSRKRRSPSSSSADSYVPSRTRRRDKRRSPHSDTGSTRRTDAPGLRGGQDDRALARGTNRNANYAAAGAGAGAGALAVRGGGGGDGKGANGHDDNNSDSSSTTDMEKTRKHMRGKEIITASLATVATIHAAHGVYSSMEAHEKRHKLVAEGEMTPEEARKKQTKAWIQDAAAVGIAALGIKGAFSEWKQMNDQRREIQDLERRKALRRKKRVAQEKAEEREHKERLLAVMEKAPHVALGYHMAQGNGGAIDGPRQGAAPQPDLSGNPYAPRDNGSQRY